MSLLEIMRQVRVCTLEHEGGSATHLVQGTVWWGHPFVTGYGALGTGYGGMLMEAEHDSEFRTCKVYIKFLVGKSSLRAF